MNVESPIGTMPDFYELTKRLGVADAIFDAWCNATSDQLWNSIDLSAVRIGYELGKAVHAPKASLRGKPLEWDETDGVEWSDKNGLGFFIHRESDASEMPFWAAWGEGDSETFATLEEAQAWCQETIDSWVRENALAGENSESLQPGIALIATECRRHVEVEGWTPEHDDEHTCGELASAAACYAMPPEDREMSSRYAMPKAWPWLPEWWKPGDRVRELVKAGSLIVAEINRLRRADAPKGDTA